MSNGVQNKNYSCEVLQVVLFVTNFTNTIIPFVFCGIVFNNFIILASLVLKIYRFCFIPISTT